MSETRYRNRNWSVVDDCGNLSHSVKGGAILATLMDIRDELQRLNTLLHCPNFAEIPKSLVSIKRNTAKPRPQKAKS